MKPTVSVIISNKNYLNYLPQAIESIWQQHIIDVEIIIADDGSTDGSWKWICEQCRIHSNIVAIKFDGVGSSTARNHAARVANGTYIAFLDADDFWYPNKLKQQLELMECNPQIGISFTNYEHINEDSEIIVDCFSYWDKFNQLLHQQDSAAFIIPEGAATIFSENIVGTSTVLVRRDLYLALDGFDRDIESASAWDLWLKIALHTDVACIKDPLSAYIRRSKNMTCSRVTRLEAMELIIQRYEQKIKALDPYAVRSAYARLAEGYGAHYREMARPVHALFCDLKAVCEQPEKRRFQNILTDLKLAVTSI